MRTVKKIKKFQQYSGHQRHRQAGTQILLLAACLVNEYNLFWWIEQSPVLQAQSQATNPA